MLSRKLTEELQLARDEDEWDDVLLQHFEVGEAEDRQRWSQATKQCLDHTSEMQLKAVQRRVVLAGRMYAIVEKERALAEEEKLRIRDEKHKIRKARRLARREETLPRIQETSTPNVDIIAAEEAGVEAHERPAQLPGKAPEPSVSDATRETNKAELGKCANLGDIHTMVSQPFEIERRVRPGSPKSTSWEEMRRIREQSSREKTPEEVAQIQEARAMRKEQRVTAKATKVKRKEEQAALWEQKSRERVKHEPEKRLDLAPRLKYTMEEKTYMWVHTKRTDRSFIDKDSQPDVQMPAITGGSS